MMYAFLLRNIMWLTVAAGLGISAIVMGVRLMWLESKHESDSSKARHCYADCILESSSTLEEDICYSKLRSGLIKECK